jgi:hypothetical protein
MVGNKLREPFLLRRERFESLRLRIVAQIAITLEFFSPVPIPQQN